MIDNQLFYPTLALPLSRKGLGWDRMPSSMLLLIFRGIEEKE
jgi:hypothetical protein